MSAYIAELNAAVERDRAQREEKERATTQAVRERLTPLDDRLSRLLATIPSEIQREGLSVASLQASLRGRWRGNCDPGELGTALRKLGFTRQRRWNDATGFCALWFASIIVVPIFNIVKNFLAKFECAPGQYDISPLLPASRHFFFAKSFSISSIRGCMYPALRNSTKSRRTAVSQITSCDFSPRCWR
jgi:hypothetical protein